MNQLKKPIVIIGGMGPQASAALYGKLIHKTINDRQITRNEDFPHIVLDSLSMPDFIADRDRKAESIALLRQATRRAERLNPSIVGMACNTAHLFQVDMLADMKLPFVSLIDAVAEAVDQAHVAAVGLLASPTTIETGLYKRALARRGVVTLNPSQSQTAQLERVIRAVIAGTAGTQEAELLLEITRSLQAQGAKAIVLGCTELPLIFPVTTDIQTFDCLDILATKLLDEYFAQFAPSMVETAIIEGKT